MNFIIDCAAPDIVKHNLKNLGNVFYSSYLDIEDKSVSSHPDMQIHFISDAAAVCEPTLFEYYRRVLPDYISLKKGSVKIGRTYPENCAYNIARIGSDILCNTKYAEKSILDYYKKQNYHIIHINQGYAKCSICPINDKAFITEDKGIFGTVSKIDGIKPILIEVGEVSLDGFEYGFIGGASGTAEEAVLFSGRVSKNIAEIVKNEGRSVTILSDVALRDIGSIISFT